MNHSAGYDGTNAKEIFYGPDMIIVLLTTGKLIMMGTDSMSFSGQPKNNLIISSSDTGYKSNGKYYDKFVEIPYRNGRR